MEEGGEGGRERPNRWSIWRGGRHRRRRRHSRTLHVKKRLSGVSEDPRSISHILRSQNHAPVAETGRSTLGHCVTNLKNEKNATHISHIVPFYPFILLDSVLHEISVFAPLKLDE